MVNDAPQAVEVYPVEFPEGTLFNRLNVFIRRGMLKERKDIQLNMPKNDH
ncbi:hypothetical protein [Desulfovulcanus sp.]